MNGNSGESSVVWGVRDVGYRKQCSYIDLAQINFAKWSTSSNYKYVAKCLRLSMQTRYTNNTRRSIQYTVRPRVRQSHLFPHITIFFSHSLNWQLPPLFPFPSDSEWQLIWKWQISLLQITGSEIIFCYAYIVWKFLPSCSPVIIKMLWWFFCREYF